MQASHLLPSTDNAIKRINHFLSHSLVVFSLSHVFTGSSNAGVNICTVQPTSAYFEAGYLEQSREPLNVNAGSVSSSVFNFNFLYKWPETASGTWYSGLGHQYTIFDFQDLDVQTNGHQHTLYLPLFYTLKSHAANLQLSFAPALSVSSNILKQPDQYDANALQGLGSLVYRTDTSDPLNWLAGFCADHRFGNFRVYPIFGLEWGLSPAWQAVLAFPDSQVTHRLSERIQWQLQVGPDGNQWHIKDKELQQSSAFTLAAWLAEWQIDWRVAPGFSLSASLGKVFNADYRFTLANGEDVVADADNSTRYRIAARLEF